MRNRVVWLAVFLLIGFIGIGPGHAQEVVNLLPNGGFESGVMSPWSTYGPVTSEVVQNLVDATIPEDPIEGDYCLHIVVPEAGVNSWDAGLQNSGHVFEAGKKYTLSAFVKSKAGDLQIHFKPELAADPWTGYSDTTMTMTEEWQEFSLTTAVLSENVDPGSITFHIQFAAGDFWIDGVRWYEGDYVEPSFSSFTVREPNPADGAIHPETWASLSWKPGIAATSHDVYFGDNFDDVAAGTGDAFRGNQGSVYYAVGFGDYAFPDGLVYGTTYYWRIDEVNDLNPDSPWVGDVWSFTVPPKTAFDPIPADGAKFLEPDVELNWMAGFDTKLHNVYFGDNFDDVDAGTGDTSKGPAGTPSFTPGTLESGTTYYWRID
ncbi:MAG TPA: carbohydrate binding domain-containing protein, partial [Sedimentisphaerales bacterium]|nr:carbohydrate binding domain-containing protein [Sedimentisphaerales bacterium]